MKLGIRFLAQATVCRMVDVEIPDDTPPEEQRHLAEQKAARAMESDEDVTNLSGRWETHYVELPSIHIDNTTPIRFDQNSFSEDEFDALDGASPLIPE